MNNCYFKPLSFGVVYYLAGAYQYTTQSQFLLLANKRVLTIIEKKNFMSKVYPKIESDDSTVGQCNIPILFGFPI